MARPEKDTYPTLIRNLLANNSKMINLAILRQSLSAKALNVLTWEEFSVEITITKEAYTLHILRLDGTLAHGMNYTGNDPESFRDNLGGFLKAQAIRIEKDDLSLHEAKVELSLF